MRLLYYQAIMKEALVLIINFGAVLIRPKTHRTSNVDSSPRAPKILMDSLMGLGTPQKS